MKKVFLFFTNRDNLKKVKDVLDESSFAVEVVDSIDDIKGSDIQVVTDSVEVVRELRAKKGRVPIILFSSSQPTFPVRAAVTFNPNFIPTLLKM